MVSLRPVLIDKHLVCFYLDFLACLIVLLLVFLSLHRASNNREAYKKAKKLNDKVRSGNWRQRGRMGGGIEVEKIEGLRLSKDRGG